MDTTITLVLGGRERTLNFGCFWFTKHYQKLASGKELTDADNLEAYIIAGLKAHCSKERTKEDFTIDDVQNWLGDLSGQEMLVIEKKVVDLLSQPVGELEAPVSGA